MMDTWQELTIEVKREAEEAASNILIELGSQGVAIDDSADYLGPVSYTHLDVYKRQAMKRVN